MNHGQLIVIILTSVRWQSILAHIVFFFFGFLYLEEGE